MSKTPFEIRLDLLNLAQQVLSDTTQQERNRLEQDWHMARELAIIAAQKGDGSDIIVPPFPSLPTITEEELIRVAKKLNDFVSNTNTEQKSE